MRLKVSDTVRGSSLSVIAARAVAAGLATALAGGVMMSSLSPVRAADNPAVPNDEGVRLFNDQVKPLLHASCFKCHGGEKIKGKLILTKIDGLRAGGEHGAALSADKPDVSLLLQMLSYRDEQHQMPPSGKLKPEEIELITRWVRMGAPWPVNADFTNPAAVQEKRAPGMDRIKDMWAVQPLHSPDVPAVQNREWVRNSIDAFILARLEKAGLQPAPPADRVALIRRATYDLTGLPPSSADVAAFLNDQAPDAYEKLIDRLLASPQYGEKWARHWLDLVRYGESNSYERDNPKPNAWRYRDYVIRAFNDDKPYDRFVKEQIAGDELPDGGNDGVIATGYYRLGIWDDEPSDRDQARADSLDDIVSTTGQTFLALTVGCARCHDHKIDPFPQKDYYKLVAFFRNVNHFNNGGPTDEMPIFGDGKSKAEHEQRVTERKQRRKAVEAQVIGEEDDFRQLLAGDVGRERVPANDVHRLIMEQGAKVLGAERFDKYRKMRGELEELRKPEPAAAVALCVTEPGNRAPDTFVMLRGSAHNLGDKVMPGFPVIFHSPDPTIPDPPAGAKTAGRRIVLADWLVSRDNPTTSRVMVNRLWQFHFGRGIVRSSSNFGLQGDKPTHPELLDWLASHFISEDGWHMKAMHRLMMTSNAYRMSSHGDEKALAADPLNDLFWRFDMRRLTAEEVRDSVLALDGTLNLKMFGPSIYVDLPKAVLATESHPGANWGNSSPEDQARRSIYIHVKRSLHVPLLDAFDAADADNTCPVRFVTVQPTQALGTLNGRFFNESALKLAARLKREADADAAAQVRLALKLATSREPTDAEVLRGLGLIHRLQADHGATPDQSMKLFCLMTLNLNEFVYLD